VTDGPARTSLAGRVSRELRLTRDLLERLPEASLQWRPHARSFTLAGLGTHLARLPHWGAQMLAQPFHDLAAGSTRREAMATRADILALFDRHVAEWDDVLARTPAATLDAPWQLRRGTAVLETLPHDEAIERYLLHHLIHHRGQLTVYLRLLDVPLLPLYGPTADQHP
jgi:uncharacterized damage-inducible protein DinB